MYKERIEGLDREIAALKAAGDWSAAGRNRLVNAHAQKAGYLLLSFRLGDFLREIVQMMAITQGAPAQHSQSAQALLDEGRRLARQPGGQKAAADLFFKAAALFHTVDDAAGEARALQAWAGVELEAGARDRAIQRLEKALAAARQSGDAGLVAQVETDLRRVKGAV